MQPYFSIITPFRNGARDAVSYVQTLQDQFFTNWEAILIDDGSTDGSAEKLRQLTLGDNRFHIAANTLPKKLSGPYQARNMGLNLAQGKFICFLDIDDNWLPNKLSVQVRQLEANPRLHLVYSAYIRVKRGSNFGKVRRQPPFWGPHIWIRIANPIPMLTACVRHSTITNLRFEALNHEDYLFWYRVLNKIRCDQVMHCRQPLAIYHIHRTSLSSNKLIAVGWIWKCYRKLGYKKLAAIMAILGRGILQTLIVCREAFESVYVINSQE